MGENILHGSYVRLIYSYDPMNINYAVESDEHVRFGEHFIQCS